MHAVKIVASGRIYHATSFIFSGGEVQTRIDKLPANLVGDVQVTARLQSSDDVMQLLQVHEILDRVHRDRSGGRSLTIPYFPCARQDRVTQHDSAFSLKSMVGLINSLNFDRVLVFDPHSDVTPALLHRAEVFPQALLLALHGTLLALPRDSVVIAPDAGAMKKAREAAHQIGVQLVTASKARDTATGIITETRLDDPGAVAGRTCLIVDDICDGGRTFIELANALRLAGAAKVLLYVTHGIFSQGLSVFEGLIDEIFTTDTFVPAGGWPKSPSVPLRVARIPL